MVSPVNTPLNIDDTVMKRLRRESARRGKTMSELVEAALRMFLQGPRSETCELPALPTFDGGGALVDIADRDALYGALEGR